MTKFNKQLNVAISDEHLEILKEFRAAVGGVFNKQTNSDVVRSLIEGLAFKSSDALVRFRNEVEPDDSVFEPGTKVYSGPVYSGNATIFDQPLANDRDRLVYGTLHFEQESGFNQEFVNRLFQQKDQIALLQCPMIEKAWQIYIKSSTSCGKQIAARFMALHDSAIQHSDYHYSSVLRKEAGVGVEPT